MKYRKTARPLSFLVASLLAFQPVTALAVTFADMNQVPWPGAEVSINKAADLGLVVGETKNGKSYFRPRDTVSLSESCQFAYKVLLQTKKASADASVTEKWATVLNTYKIQDWAHPAISFCLEKGIISISDLSNFVKNGTNMPASREQAAEILGRALTVGVPSYKATASTTKFVDNASISADARPYIALLNEVKIVNGDDTNRFNPKKTLNRTETAVMVTNLYEKLNSAAAVETPSVPVSSSKSGKVAALTNFYVNFENSNAYYLYTSAGIPVTLDGDSSSVTEVAELFKDGSAMEATVTLNESNRVTKLTVTSDSAKKEDTKKDTKGTITDMYYDDEDEDGKIEINDKSVYHVSDVNDVTIKIEDEDGDEEEYDWEELLELFEECKDDDKEIEVELTLNSKDKLTKIVGSIEEDSKSSSSSKPKGDKKGDVADVEYDEDDEEGKIKIGSKKYNFDDDTTIKIDDKSADGEDLLEAFEEAEDDDEVLEAILVLDDDDDDYATKIYIYTEAYDDDDDEDEVSGKIQNMTYDEDDEDGDIKVDGDTFKAKDADDVEIEVQDGNTKLDSWEELYNAFKDGKTIDVELVVDDDEVTEITGKVTVTKGVLTGFGDDHLKLKGKKSKATTKYYFTEYDRDDEDEEEDWEDDVKDIDVSGLNNVDDLYDFFDVWLDDEDTDLDDDVFTMEIKLDKDGFIVEIDAELD